MRRTICHYVPTVVGAILLYAGIHKLIYPGESTLALEALGVRHHLASSATMGLTAGEIYVGVILLLRANLNYALALATALMAAFTIFLAYLSTLAQPPSCGCLGLKAVFQSNRSNALLGMLRNCAIIWLLQAAREYYFPPSARAATPAPKPASAAPGPAHP